MKNETKTQTILTLLTESSLFAAIAGNSGNTEIDMSQMVVPFTVIQRVPGHAETRVESTMINTVHC